MSFAIGGAALATIATSAYSARQQKKAAQAGTDAQVQSTQAGIEEQRRQFDAIQALLDPYVKGGAAALPGFAPFQEVGLQALEQQRALTGLGGPQAQKAAIDAIQGSPMFGALTRQGENAILQSASATGGLRGGNVQEALLQFRPQLLSQMINEQYGRLGGLSSSGLNTTTNLAQLGQAAAAGTGSAGLQTGNNITSLLGQQGAAFAGNALARGQANIGMANSLNRALGMYFGGGGGW